MTGTLAGISAALIFGGGYFVLGLGFFPALIASSVWYVGLAARAAQKSVRARRAAAAAVTPGAGATDRQRRAAAAIPDANLDGLGITQEQFKAALAQGAGKLVKLKQATGAVRDESVRAKANAVCDAVARILTDIREDPKDLRPARKFLDYYLDATITVVERYNALASKGVTSDEARESLTRAENSLDTIRSAYEKQLEQLLENDVMDLDTELQVLERTIKMEGLGS